MFIFGRQAGQHYDTGRGRAAPASQGQQPPQAQGQAGAYMDLAQALVMLNALPSALRGCLLEAARLCGSAAGGAQAHLLSMHWAAQARSHDDDLRLGGRAGASMVVVASRKHHVTGLHQAEKLKRQSPGVIIGRVRALLCIGCA